MLKTKNILLNTLLFLAVFTLSFSNANAQCGPLATPTVTNNGQDGIMFDVVALTNVNLTQLAMDFDSGTHTIEIYGKTGTHVGFANNAAAWTLLGTATGWVATGGTNVTIPITFSKILCPGQVYSFYVTSTTGGCNYSNGTAVGNNAAINANIRILQGTGKDYPFAASFTPRTPNVKVFYSCLTGCCVAPTMTFTQETCIGSCNGTATATVGAGGVPPYSYQWNAAAGNQTTQTATNLCAGTYSVNVTDGNGCVSTAIVTVTSGAATSNATITPAGPFCLSAAAVNLTAATGGGTWSGPGITNATTGTFNPSVAGVGTHTITYTIGGPCGDTKTTTITVNPNADATITAAGPFCVSDASVTLSAATAGGSWSGTGITNTTTGVFDPATAGVGTHTITYTIAGACGDTKTTTITVNPDANATITPVGPYCISNPAVTLTAVTSGGTWSGPGITNASAGTFDPSVAGAGTHTITYTVSGPCGDSQTTTIVVNASFDATITPAGPFCETDAAVTLTAVDPNGLWSGTGITNSTTGDFDPGVAGPGVHTITYAIGGACGDTKTTAITVNHTYNATITHAGPFCELDPAFSLTAAETGGVWSGQGITDATNGVFDPGVAGPGTHTITYTIAAACGDTQTTDILVNANDDATITQVGPFCLGSPVVSLAAVTSGGTWSGNGVNASTGEFDPDLAGPGTHTITYTTFGPCPDTHSIDILVNSALSVQASTDDVLCAGESSSLSATGSGGDGNLTYTWTDASGNTVGTGTTITLTPGTTTTYTVTLTDGCSTPAVNDGLTVTVNPIPVVNISANETSGCSPLDVVFVNASAVAGSTYAWSFGNGSFSTDFGTASEQFTGTGCFDVSLTVTLNGCTMTQTVNDLVCVANEPVADFMADPYQTDIFDTEIAFTNQSTDATTYTWDFDDMTLSAEENPTHTYDEEPGSYMVCLAVSNEMGCRDTICKPVRILESLIYYIPNSFTPDGDEFNQVFSPVFYSGIDIFNFNFVIYNRWGEVIWETNDPSVGWDGVGPDGKLVQSGTYVWKVKLKIKDNDKHLIETGHVNVLK